MSELKTKKTTASVSEFLDAVPHPRIRAEAKTVRKILEKVTGDRAAMWGTTMVGFGTWHYKYASGQEGDWPLAAFAPRKNNLVLYIMPGFEGYDELIAALGNPKHGKSCIYMGPIEEKHHAPIATIVKKSMAHTKRIVREREAAAKASKTKRRAK